MFFKKISAFILPIFVFPFLSGVMITLSIRHCKYCNLYWSNLLWKYSPLIRKKTLSSSANRQRGIFIVGAL